MSETFPFLAVILVGVGGLALGVAAILATVFMGMWIYNDAKDRGIEHPALWVVLAIVVSNLIGLVIYLVVRATQSRKVTCPECGFMVAEIQGFCPRCGAKQPPLLPRAESNGKAKKNLRRMLISFGAVAIFTILFLVFYFVFFFQLAINDGAFTHSNASLVRLTDSYVGTMINSNSNASSGNLSFSKLNGSYKVMNVRATDGEQLNLDVEFSVEGGGLSLELRGTGETYTLEQGINAISGLSGSYSVVAVAKDAQEGSVRVQRIDS